MQMLGVATGSTLAGFLTTVLLLRMDVRAMWVRYGVSVAVAYGVFLLLIWAWVRYYRMRPVELIGLATVGRRSEERRWADDLPVEWLELFGEELGLAVLAALVLILVLAWLLVAAPEWIAELVLDAVCGAVLVERLRQIPARNWLGSTLRKTAGPFVCLFLLFVGAGAVCHAYVPEAKSIGGVVRHITRAR